MLSRDDEKKPCCEILCPKCGRGIPNLELTISIKEKFIIFILVKANRKLITSSFINFIEIVLKYICIT